MNSKAADILADLEQEGKGPAGKGKGPQGEGEGKAGEGNLY